MKTLKKITAVAVMLAMVLSMMSIGVFATDDGITVSIEAASTTVGQGKKVVVNVCYTVDAETVMGSHGFTLKYKVPENAVVTPLAPDGAAYIASNKSFSVKSATEIALSSMSSYTLKAGKNVVASMEIEVPADAVKDSTITFAPEGLSFLDADFGDIASTIGTTSTITVVEAFTVNAVADGGEIELPMMTSEADVIAKLKEKIPSVKITDPEAHNDKTVNVTDWACKGTYNPKSGEAQEFVGTLESNDTVTVASGVTAKATVKLTQLTTAKVSMDSTLELTVKKNADGTKADLENLIKEADPVIALIDEAGIRVDTIELDKTTIAFTGDKYTDETGLDTSEKGNSVTAKLTVPAGTESKDKVYKLADEMELPIVITITVKASSTNNSVAGIGVAVGGNTNTNNGTNASDDKTDDDATTTPDDDTRDDATTPDDDTKDDDTNNTPAATEFGDVPASYWAYDFITTLKDMGIINGKDNGNFEPDAQLTRAEFAKMIAVAFGLTATSDDSKFVDCTANDWYTEFVNAVAEAGYVNGKDDANFGANDPISRQEICTILGRILGVEDAGELNFTDADSIADWAQAAVAALVEMGVVNGYEDGTFNGAANATRAEVAKMLVTFLTAIAAE